MTLVSLGLFILVINALLFWLVAHLVEGFHVAGFWSAFLAAILVGLLDTAGRLHTKSNLMAELEKMKRTASKVIPGAPHGLCTTHADVINQELLAFLKS